MALWCRLTAVDSDGSRVGTLSIDGDGLPDMSAVDQLARWVLEAQRARLRIALECLTPEMAGLLDLAGLGLEVQWKAERGEKPCRLEGVQEKGHLGDLPA